MDRHSKHRSLGKPQTRRRDKTRIETRIRKMVQSWKSQSSCDREGTSFEVSHFRSRWTLSAWTDGGARLSGRRRSSMLILHRLRVCFHGLVPKVQDLVLRLPRVLVRLRSSPHQGRVSLLNQGVNLVFTKDKKSCRQRNSFWCNWRFERRIQAPVKTTFKFNNSNKIRPLNLGVLGFWGFGVLDLGKVF